MQAKTKSAFSSAGMSKRATVHLLSLLALAGWGATGAQAMEVTAGQRLAATCANCHGTDGATRGVVLPPLAGQKQQTLVEAMKAFRAGTRESTIMQQLAKGYSDEQIEAVAAYLAQQPAPKKP